MKNIFCLFLILFLMGCGIDKESPPSLSSVNNTGELDTSFNDTGYLALNGSAGGSADDEIFDLATDSEGRIIAVGSSTNVSGNKDMTVWRLTSSGILDTSFSGNGIYTHNGAAGGNGNDIAYSVTLNSSDEIFVTGTSLNGSGNFDMVIWKLSSSGTLDSSFSGDGIYTHDNAAGGSLQDQGSAIALDSSGNIVVAGFSDQTVTNRDLAVWRLTSSGVPDNSFSGDGIFTDDGSGGGEDENGNALLIDSADNVYVIGRADSAAASGDMAVWKLSSSGVLDSSFSGDGFFSHNNAAGGNSFDEGTDVTSSSSGAFFISGYSRTSSGDNAMVVWKVIANGTLDTTFDSDGYVVDDVTTSDDSGEAIIIDSENRIVVSGTSNEDMAIWRFDQEGAADTDFNTDGFFAHDSAAGGFDVDSGMALTEDSSDRLYIGGFSENAAGDLDASFWRLK